MTIQTILFGQSKKLIKIKALADKIPLSDQVVSREIKDISVNCFTEVRTMKKGTVVIRDYLTEDKFESAKLLQKRLYPATNEGKSAADGGIEYMTEYNDNGGFLATLKCNSKKSLFTTFAKNKETGLIESTRGIGAFNRATAPTQATATTKT